MFARVQVFQREGDALGLSQIADAVQGVAGAQPHRPRHHVRLCLLDAAVARPGAVEVQPVNAPFATLHQLSP